MIHNATLGFVDHLKSMLHIFFPFILFFKSFCGSGNGTRLSLYVYHYRVYTLEGGILLCLKGETEKIGDVKL